MARVLSVVATLVLLGAVALLYVSGGLVSQSPYVWAVQAAAILLMLWARFTFGWRSFHLAANPTAGGLVTSGPYRFVRNPIYSAVWLFTWAGAAAHLTLATAGSALLILAMLAVRIYCEEGLLIQEFPDYAAYAAKTARLIPFIL
ncbi:MAG: methyltransferase [Acidobacteriota bacterium]